MRRSLIVVIVGLSTIATGGFSTANEAPLQSSACTVTCLTAICDWTKHKAQSDGTLDEYDGGPHGECLDQSCAWYDEEGRHPACGVHELAIDALRAIDAAIGDNDAQRIAAALSKTPEVLQVNAKRASIQVIGGCPSNRSVIANVPIDRAMLDEISNLLQVQRAI